jgi:type I restriction enzyme M protein
MTSCLLITNNNKKPERKGKVLFVQAVNEVRNEKTISYLDPHHIDRIYNAYQEFKEESNFTAIKENETILEDKNARLNVQLFVKEEIKEFQNFDAVLNNWETVSKKLKNSMSELFKTLANE